MPDLENLKHRLDRKSNPNTKAWWEAYLKHAIQFRGVKMADIRLELHAWLKEEDIFSQLSPGAQIELGLELLRASYCEDKLAGVLLFQEVLIPADTVVWHRELPGFAALFDDGHIYEWNTCDWFCIKVLGPMVIKFGPDCARAIADWRYAENLWRRRAAGVAFVNLAKNGDGNFAGFTEMVLQVCAATVQSPERFAQTGTGWVLRELSQALPQGVLKFIKSNLALFSVEGLRSALAKYPGNLRSDLMKYHQQLLSAHPRS